MISCNAFSCKYSDLQIDRKNLFHLLGYGNHTPKQEIIDIIDETEDMLKNSCAPQYGYSCFRGETIDNENIKIGKIIFRPGSIITKALKKSDFYAVFVASAGEEFDILRQKIKKEDDILSYFILDSLGSVLAESVVTLLVKNLETDMASKQLKITNNYSPGYCDWLLEEQKKIFELFPVDFCGVKLTDSFMMIPVKSVSGIIGIGTDVKKTKYGCSICKNNNCIKNLKR